MLIPPRRPAYSQLDRKVISEPTCIVHPLKSHHAGYEERFGNDVCMISTKHTEKETVGWPKNREGFTVGKFR